MKKVILAVALLLVGTSTTFFSCKKTQSESVQSTKFEKINYSISFQNNYKYLGNLHNSGIYNLLSNDDIVNSNYTSQDIHNSISSRTYNFLIASDSVLYFSNNDSFENSEILNEIISSELFNNPNENWDMFLSPVENKISSQELALINELKQIFDVSYSIQDPINQSDFLNSEIQKIEAKFNNIQWNLNEGDLAGGMISIALYSAMLWSPSNVNNNPNNIDEPIISVTEIVKADCIGYLYGWGKAWLWDEVPNPKDRIKAGVGTALEFSLMKRLAAYL